MEFKSYPFDKQECDIIFESVLLPVEQLQMKWAPNDAIKMTKNFELYGFTIDQYLLSETVSDYPFTGNFSAVVITISLARSMLTSLLDVYIPTTLFVIVSWLTFWIEVPAAPARVTLGMTTMLTLVTASKSSREKLPRVSYANALDVWIFVCTCKQSSHECLVRVIILYHCSHAVFVFATLVEYSAVNYIYNKNKRSKKRRAMTRCLSFESMQSDLTTASNHLHSLSMRRSYDEKPSPESVINGFNHHLHEISTKDSKGRSVSIATTTVGSLIGVAKKEPMDTANMVDKYCRLLFPFGFSLFNIVYWFILWSPK
ncbi:Glycine receptor subunit alpha-3-like protein [Leptotrombidium deliense]|uniref:Glycine receptor subunit alpha-3-like protein n=1 Tax=Leptotrombidium deliense TaxID=299467 RepID=A0A443SGM7_9ACAR|nr:Glycine receptor subunit alpha-3-like protein [Leptotrombidium deliense]